jgi:hypothetical protein
MDAKRCYARLSKKQRAVIRDVLEHGMTEYGAMEKNHVRPCDYRRWLESGYFRSELDKRIEAELRQKLLAMMRTEKGAAARRACFELISLLKDKTATEDVSAEGDDELLDISDEQANRMLAILAEDEKKI